MAWYVQNGMPIVEEIDGESAIAIDENCCCDSDCCPNDIDIPDGFGNGTLLRAEIIDATNNCATVGASQVMNITSPGFWRLDDCLDPDCDFGPIVLACGGTPEAPEFTLSYGGFPICGCPSPGAQAPSRVFTNCDPFELVFLLTISSADTDPDTGPCREAGAGCCEHTGEDATVTIRITRA